MLQDTYIRIKSTNGKGLLLTVTKGTVHTILIFMHLFGGGGRGPWSGASENRYLVSCTEEVQQSAKT